MATRPKRRFWRICFLCFRRFRIAVWFLIFVLLSILVYLNQVGLPGFIKTPLLQKLHDRGLDLQFSRIRLRWYQGIVADNVRFEQADAALSPQLTLGEVQLLFNVKALTRLKFQIDALALRRGRLVWPLAATNQPNRQLSIERIETDLRFLPDDQWALDNFKASFRGARIRLSGIVTNASAARDWKFVQQAQPAEVVSPGSWQERFRRLSEVAERIQFSSPPELVLDVRGDARDFQSFGVVMLLTAPGADTPWGNVSKGNLNVRVYPAATNGMSRAELHLQALDARTPWAAITNFDLTMQMVSFPNQTNLVEADLTISTRNATTRWGSANNTRFAAHWVHAMTDPVPLSGYGWLECENAQTTWAKTRQCTISADLKRADPALITDPAWGWWTNLAPYFLSCQFRASQLAHSNLLVETVAFSANWRAGRLLLTNVDMQLYGGRFNTSADLDVSTRALKLNLTSDFDPQKIKPILPDSAQRWLNQFAWNAAPRLKGDLAVVLPAWTNRQPDWRAEMLPTLQLNGEFNLERGGIYQQKLELSSARSHFVYSNMCWHLPDLALTRPEGTVSAEHRANDVTRDFYWRVSSTVDVRAVRPFLQPKDQLAFDLFTFTQPPVLSAEIRGRYEDDQRTGLKARVALTNFTFRGDAFSGLQVSLQYSNQLVQLFDPRIQVGPRDARAAGLAIDLKAQRVYLTNGFSTLDPMLIARAIGTNVVKAIESYRFLNPPVASVQGTIPLHGEADADLHFDLDGGPFEWWKFKLPHIAGHVHWAGESLSLSEIRADFYGGQAAGAAKFDFRPQKGTDFLFAVAVTNVQLHPLLADLSTSTNHVEGALSGALSVTKANTETWHSVEGFGETNLRDGLLWDIPLFGILSPVLNGISPGLGNSRASAATCSFVITNGVVLSQDMDIRSTGMRLKYRGTVDLESRLNARVEAELLRDMWIVGPLVSTVLWPVTKMFEYKVHGTLEEPKTEPVFIVPKIMLMPFHTFRAPKGSKPEENAPPQN